MQRMAEQLRERMGSQGNASAGGAAGGGAAGGGSAGSGASGNGGAAGGGARGGAMGSGAQRALAQQAEEEARRLERLARDQRTPELAQAAERLQQAASAMRRAAGGSAAQGSAALEALQRALRDVEGGQAGSAARAVAGVAERARALEGQQQAIAAGAQALGSAEGAARTEGLRRLMAEKSALEAGVRGLEEEAERVARTLRRSQPRAARSLQEGAQAMRDSRLADKVAFSQQLLRGRSAEYVRAFEAQIAENLRDVADRMQGAAAALTGASPTGRLERSLERLRGVVAGVEAAVGDEAARAGQPRGGAGRDGAPSGGAPQGDAARAFGARRATAEGIRREVAEAGVETDQLDRGIAALRALEQRREGGAPQETAQLQREALEQLRAFETALAQALGREAGNPPAAGARGTVPPAFRGQVEGYFRGIGARRLP